MIATASGNSLAQSSNHIRNASPGQESSRLMLGLMALHRASIDPAHPEAEAIVRPGTLKSLLTTLQMRDAAVVRHSRRVALMASGLAKHLGWEGKALRSIELAALLHDIGKIGVPDHILLKPTRLNAEEAELMALHYNIGLDVLQACRVDREVIEIIAQSHNAYGTMGDTIATIGVETLLGSRILAACDAYESLCATQKYRKSHSHLEIMEILEKGTSRQFDGNVVEALSRWVAESGLPFDVHSNDSFDLPPCNQSPEEVTFTNELYLIFGHLYVIESLYDGFTLIDGNLNFSVWSRGAEALLGHTPAEMLGRTWSSRGLRYLSDEGQPLPEELTPMHQVLQSQKPVTREILMERSNGRQVRLEVQTVPLIEDNQVKGVIEIYRDLSRSSKRRPQEFRELKLAASRDALTSVANRGELETQLAELTRKFSENPSEMFSVIFCDVDHFKSVNDTHGHQVGDKVLVELARLLQCETYSGELVGRYGGEEFVVLCPDTNLESVERRAERLRTAVQKLKFAGTPSLQLTASFGVTQSELGDSVESVIRRADKALYQAKSEGRNRTCVLTNSQMLNPTEERKSNPAKSKADPFEVTGMFHAFIAADLVTYKFKAYVNGSNARLLSVNDKKVVFRVGENSWFGRWGKSDSSQAVRVETILGETETVGRSRTQRIQIHFKIVPAGRINDTDVFQRRARNVLRELKEYFAADNVEE